MYNEAVDIIFSISTMYIWAGSVYTVAVDMICSISTVYTRAEDMIECVHRGSVYTAEGCTLGQCEHCDSVYTEAVCTLRQCVH